MPDTKGKCTNKSCNFAAKMELTTIPIQCKKRRSKIKLLTEHSPERRAFTVHNWNQEIDHNIQRKTLVLSLYSPRICKETNYVTHFFLAQNPRCTTKMAVRWGSSGIDLLLPHLRKRMEKSAHTSQSATTTTAKQPQMRKQNQIWIWIYLVVAL